MAKFYLIRFCSVLEAFFCIVLFSSIFILAQEKNLEQIAPKVSITSPKDGVAIKGTSLEIVVDFNIHKSNEKGQGNVHLVWIALNGVVIGTYKNPSQIKSGTHTFLIDMAGKSDEVLKLQAFASQGDPKAGIIGASSEVCVIVDNTPPVITNLTPPDGSVVNITSPTISASWSDNLSGIDIVSAQLMLDGKEITSNAIMTTTEVTFTPSPPLSVGEHLVIINVVDFAGNLAIASSAFRIVAVAAPNIAIQSELDFANIEVGETFSNRILVNFETELPGTFHILVKQAVFPDDGGIKITSDYPLSGIVANKNTGFEVHEQITGLKVGSYEITKMAEIVETGIHATIKQVIEVEPKGPKLLPIGTIPEGIPLGVRQDVIFSTRIVGLPNPPVNVILKRVDISGNVLAVIGPLVDNGTNGDLLANDFDYSGTFAIQEWVEGNVYFQAEAIASNMPPITSKVCRLPVTRFPIEIEPYDETKIIVAPNPRAKILSNRIVIVFIAGVSPDTIETIIKSIGGIVVGTILTFNSFTIEILDTGDSLGVYAAIAVMESYEQVKYAIPSIIENYFEVTPNDVQYLSQWALKHIRADEAWITARGSNKVLIK